MKQILKNSLLVILLFLVGVVISRLIPQKNNSLLLDNEFLITFTGVVLGISATIVTFIFSSTDKVKNVLEGTYSTPEKVSEIFEIFKRGFTELVQESNFIFK